MDTELVMGLIPLAGGFLLDKILGDPLWLPHPVVGFGKLISRCERRGNQGAHRRRNGAWTAIGLVVLTFLVSKGLLEAAAGTPGLLSGYQGAGSALKNRIAGSGRRGIIGERIFFC